ncbi:MAG: tetratricopeptide repeat protein [Bacteroidota bacterium]|nr:tetratricopeptide repeat protein [Bacteroidota bacterium]
MLRNYSFLFIVLFSFHAFSQDKELNNHVYNGNELASKKVFDEAEMSYRKALSTTPGNSKALYNLGNTHYNEKDFDEATQRYFQTQKISDDKFQKHKAFHNMGNIFMQQKEYAKAVEAYKNGLRNNSADDQTRYNYALAKELLENEKQSQKDKDNQKDKKEKEDQKQDNKENKDEKEDGDSENQEKDKKDDDKSKKDGDEDKKKNKKKNQKPKKNQEDDLKKDSPKQKGGLSNQQMKSLLEAMNNQEKKVQDKVNAKKIKGVPIRGKKDW